jgi:hypothetical protein
MKLKSKFEKILSNKILLNVIMIITFFNLIGYVMLQKTIAIVYFILIGLLTSFFSKNMTIVLGIPLILVNLFVANSNKWSMSMNYNREGLENNNTSMNKTNNNNNGNNTSSNQPIKNAIIAKKNSLANANANNSSTTTSSSQGLPMTITPIQDNDSNITFDNSMDNPSGESFEVGRSKKNSKGYNIDYASTVEDAYDELNKLLGSDGIKRLTNDTQSLMKQQLQLAESMKGMQPLIAGMAPLMQQAQGLLGNMGDNGNLNNLADIAKKLTSTLGNNNNTTN